MTRVLPFLAAVGILVCPERSDAAALLQDLAISGTCSELVLPGPPHARGCVGRISYSLLDDGQTTFEFEGLGPDSAVVAFHGRGLSETSAGPGMTILPVDSMVLGRAGQARTLPATGQCIYGDPFRGPATVRCTAAAENAAYRGTFASDGQPPQRRTPPEVQTFQAQMPRPQAPRRKAQ